MEDKRVLFFVAPILMPILISGAVFYEDPIGCGIAGFFTLCWIVGLVDYFDNRRKP